MLVSILLFLAIIPAIIISFFATVIGVMWLYDKLQRVLTNYRERRSPLKIVQRLLRTNPLVDKVVRANVVRELTPDELNVAVRQLTTYTVANDARIRARLRCLNQCLAGKLNVIPKPYITGG